MEPVALTVLQLGAFPFPTGHGSQVYVRGMSQALVRRGHTVIVGCYSTGAGVVSQGLDVVRTPRLPGVAFTGSGPHWSKVPADLLLARNVARILRRRRIDVVHAHNVEGPLIARLASGRHGPPLVHNLHTRMAEELGVWMRLPAASALGAALDRAAAAAADANVAISPAAAEHLRRIGARRITHVPPGIDLDELAGADAARARATWALGARDWVVYAGNLDAYQDVPVLVRAMARTRSAGLLVVTHDDTTPLDALADAAGLPADRRRFVRSSSFADTKDALAAAALAAMPRSRCAGFPIKLLNQLGLGVPTVAAEGCAQPIGGVVSVPNGDEAAMAAAIEGLLADPERRLALGEIARLDVARAYTWDAQAATLEALYHELIAHRRA